jgi:hypothetical protein
MATERQIAANRANAKRSTGPKTVAGKLRASRNAYRHGLSRPLPLNSLATARVEAIVKELVDAGVDAGAGAGVGAAGPEALRQWGEAQLELLRVRSIRAEMWDGTDITSAKALHRLMSIDRYETEALRRRRRAVRESSAWPLGKI